MMNKLAKFLKAPIFVWWDITQKCNFKCKQCYSDSGHQSANELTTKEAVEVINQLADLKVFFVYFLGGEPLLREDICLLIKNCAEKGIMPMLSTNGWFVNENTAGKLKQSGLRHVRVSLDGATAEVHDSIRGVVGSFNKALDAIKILKKVGIETVGISPTLLSDNLHQIGQIIDLAIENGVDEIQVVQVCSTGRGENLVRLNFEQLQFANDQLKQRIIQHKNKNISATEGVLDKKCRSCISESKAIPSIIGCSGGRTCAAINAEGFVSPCILSREPAGSLRKDTFNKIWLESSLFTQMRTIRGSCLNCDLSSVCIKECSLERKASEGQRKAYAASLKLTNSQMLGCYQIGETECFLKLK